MRYKLDILSQLLLVDSGEAVHRGNKDVFSFELVWFERDDFLALIAMEWASKQRRDSNIDIWQFELDI